MINDAETPSEAREAVKVMQTMEIKRYGGSVGSRYAKGGYIEKYEAGGTVNNNSPINITVNVEGNLMSSEYVEGELAQLIRDAVRKGTDYGMVTE